MIHFIYIKLRVKEPEFSRATASLGQAIAHQLIDAAGRSRMAWNVLFAGRKQEIEELAAEAAAPRKTISNPLVKNFILEWAGNIQWVFVLRGASMRLK
ncbi:MAG TPA: hypothetical protein VEP30_06385 [Chthoniobacterales bacterium]|nr:hypothetical protein [Chthoniobacterales bacterium]